MQRLTYKLGNQYGLNDEASSKVGLFTDYDGFYAYLVAVNKLGRYEDLAEQGRLVEFTDADYQDLLDYRNAEKILLEEDEKRTVWYISPNENEIYSMQGNTVLLLLTHGIHKFYDTYKEVAQALAERQKNE